MLPCGIANLYITIMGKHVYTYNVQYTILLGKIVVLPIKTTSNPLYS